MPTTYTPLATTTLGSAQASVTLSDISGAYTDLMLVISAQSTQATTYDNLNIQFNSDTGTNYSRQRLNAFSGGATAENSANASAIGVGVITGTSFSSSIFSQSITHIQNYSNTTTFKSVVFRSGSQDAYVQAGVSTWRSTSAITSIDIKTASGSNLAAGSTFSLYGIASAAVVSGAKATGGDVVATDGTYWYHAFRASGTFTPTQTLSCDVLTIAGGGGGGLQYAGGGGAGGVAYQTGRSVSSATTVTVGGGGAKATSNTGGTRGSTGSNTVFDTITANGGGGGGGWDGANTGANGGSGGGGSMGSTTNSSAAGGSATQGSSGGATGYGFAGGAGQRAVSPGSNFVGGGGGGAGAAGSNGSSSGNGGAGGAGLNTWSSWLSVTGLGVSGFIAGGGGGCTGIQGGGTAGGAGGSGGGGTGCFGGVASTAGTTNTGSGGGGGYEGVSNGDASAGGSGLVLVRYAV